MHTYVVVFNVDDGWKMFDSIRRHRTMLSCIIYDCTCCKFVALIVFVLFPFLDFIGKFPYSEYVMKVLFYVYLSVRHYFRG